MSADKCALLHIFIEKGEELCQHLTNWFVKAETY